MARAGMSGRGAAFMMPSSQSASQLHLYQQRVKQQSTNGGNDHDDDLDDDDDALFTTLTLDGVQEGPYMLCKHTDDLLGHHARQVFREKASSMRGENSIYYYLKELMKKFGGTTNPPTAKKLFPQEPEQLVLEAHAFRKLIASDPAFECAISSDQVDALFHRIEQDHQKVIRHQDFVEFCLLDHNQLRLLLFKYRRVLKKLRLTDNELADTFRRLCRADSSEMTPELLHSAISRELDVVLTSGEVGFMMRVMDCDRDGVVKISDFEIFIKDDTAAMELVHPVRESSVVDIKISIHEADEINHRREGYSQLFPKLQDAAAATAMYLWFKSGLHEEGKAAISNIKYAATSRETDLVAKGFTCLKQDLNRNGAFGKHKYMWVSYAPSNIQTTSEIIDLALTCGDLSDKNDARLWLPPHRGFKLVPGNLNEKNAKVGIFLWLRRRRLASSHDLVDPHIDQALDSPRSKSTLRLHIDDLEEHVRKTLRRNCPIDQDGALNFGRLFDEFDTKKTRGVSRQAALVGIESFGIKMVKKDFALVWDRMNPFRKKQIDTTTFTQFLGLNDSEIDGVVNTLQRSMTTRSGYSAPNYRLIFQSYNSLSDGKLNRADFQRIFATNQLNFTNSELNKVMQRFDVNKDGIVDYADFLRYVTGVCDASSRIAGRIFDAAEEIRTWAIEKQNKKLAKDGNIDSTSAWKLLKTKHGIVETVSLDHILRQRNARLDSDKLQLLKVLIAPATNGEVNQVAFHSFVNHFPKKIKTMVYDLKKIIGPVPQDSKPDMIFDRLNVEGNGKLSLVNFTKEINALAIEKNANAIDLKDFVYAVEWTGANCGGDGAVLIDRFVATVRETQERRNMKNEFVTHYDSPQFMEGVQLLREEIKKCAKTPDGRLNYLIPFRLFDKDSSGEIVLSEFELAIRELGVDKYLSDQEIKSLMRRFDPNSSGAIDYDEFLRFNLAESTSSSSRKLCISPSLGQEIRRILEDIIIHERLSSTNIAAFCSSLKRMFGIIDKESTGFVPGDRFVQTLREMGITIPKNDMEIVVKAFAGDGDNQNDAHYVHFCDMLLETCSLDDEGSAMGSGPPATELLDLLMNVHGEYHTVRRKTLSAGYAEFDFYRAFGIEKDQSKSLYISPEELKEVLWAAGVRHPYLREELEAIIACFQVHQMSGFNVAMFCKFVEKGPSALFEGNSGSLDVYVTRLRDQLMSYLSSGKDAEERLFRLFSEFDEDSSGSISQEEFIKLLQMAGFRHYLSPEDEKLLLKFLDANGDGSIMYSEFLEFATHGDEKLNMIVANDQSNAVGSPAPSPSKPVSPVKPVGSPNPSPRKDSPSRKSAFASSLTKVQPYDMLVYCIWKLNQKLRPEFPFEKYFKKYRASDSEPQVKKRVFEKIIDKFLSKLTECRVTYNMHEMDVELLAKSYGSRDGTTINYSQFLNDLVNAKTRVLAERGGADAENSSSSSSSSSDDDELSCSSDEGDTSSRRKQLVLTTLLGDAVKRIRKSKSDLELLRAQLKAITGEWEEKKREKVSENKIYKLLTKFAIRLRKKEVDLLLPALAIDANRRKMYDSKRFFKMLDDVVAAELGGNKAEKTPAPATPAEKPTSAPSSLSANLAEKIYHCFLAAAQQNISGRKLLEKCDPKKTGSVTLLEFQAVLRLMGCTLTESELEQAKKVLGNGKNAQLSYIALVEQISKHQQQAQKHLSTKAPHQARSEAPITQSRPPSIQIPSNVISPVTSSSSNPQSRNQAAVLPVKSQSNQVMVSREEVLRVDSFLRPFFSDLLQARNLSRDAVIQSFEAYDMKGTGFVSVDAFYSVMRKLDIWLPADVSPTVLSRFTSLSGEKFDYIDFCHVVFRGQDLALAARRTTTSSTGSSNAGNLIELRQSQSSSKIEEFRAPAASRVALSEERGESVTSRVFSQRSSLAEPANLQRPSVSLPTLDAEVNSGVEQRRNFSAREGATTTSFSSEGASSTGWSCPVCFHTQTKATPTCEICAAQNPASVVHELLLQCSECAFRNKPSAATCELCRLPLRSQKKSSSSQDPLATAMQMPQSPKKMQLKLPLNVPYDEGWLT